MGNSANRDESPAMIPTEVYYQSDPGLPSPTVWNVDAEDCWTDSQSSTYDCDDCDAGSCSHLESYEVIPGHYYVDNTYQRRQHDLIHNASGDDEKKDELITKQSQAIVSADKHESNDDTLFANTPNPLIVTQVPSASSPPISSTIATTSSPTPKKKKKMKVLLEKLKKTKLPNICKFATHAPSASSPPISSTIAATFPPTPKKKKKKINALLKKTKLSALKISRRKCKITKATTSSGDS